ncbi:uncharacterized protein ARMOST_15923 [Armillaria ostoyae]|uniref:CxC2-like cysteine cluster KDZ transposase-associated domain-containing protein n=1 Tax=Armillaria ostoyae TaxID=47428 RepID=A0A284RUP9_ARMOS|nr:uncharacterized protein ARMOST_15923 [Armillaria ostoyae]
MNYKHRKKGGCAPVDIIDEASDDEEVRIRVPRSSQSYHHHTDYSSQAGSTGINPPLPPPEPAFFDTSSLLSGMSGMSFLDPDYTAPAEVAHGVDEGARRARPLGDHPLLVWTSQREAFMAEMLYLEAPVSEIERCHACRTSQGQYRCVSCFDGRMLCARCIVNDHHAMPFHKVEEWTGTYFKRTTLADLGLIIQLGHRLGQKCILPVVVKSFIVIDVDGIHSVQMGFCNCSQSIERQVQLLRSRLWPATTIYPQTAATFCVLHQFQVLSFMSKVSAYEFYHTLARLSDNTGLHTPPDRYDTFLRIMCEWRHLRSLKRFGRGHEPGGIAATKPGELVLCCPACPHPRVNLPPGWMENLGKRWLYRLFLAVDANFRLRRLNVSSEDNDPSLNCGYGYFVEENDFRSFLETYGKIIPAEEKSTCNNHDAVKLANSRGGQGAAATGVGAVVCRRHDMKRPLSVGDLQKGERYINMDYFVLSTLTCDTPPDLVISYDIACQWHKNLFVRIDKYPTDLQPDQREYNILYLVPKFHLPAHILKNADAARYRQVYAALGVVSEVLGKEEWKGGLLALKDGDVRGLDSYNEATSEGQRTLSWIWKTNLQGGEKGLQEALRIEWCKSRARAQRWQEECDLLTEEIHRVQVTFQYYSGVWEGRATRTNLPGAKAYALRQATLWSDLRASAAARWNEVTTSLPAPSVDFDPTMDLDLRGRRP